jgi:hypothetical protein
MAAMAFVELLSGGNECKLSTGCIKKTEPFQIEISYNVL